jgi:hypothetical protein
MKRKKLAMFLCFTLASIIGGLMIGFLVLGVRAFATADMTRFIFFNACAISVAILALYFVLHRSIRVVTDRSLSHETPYGKRRPRSEGNPVGDAASEGPPRAGLAVVKTTGDSIISRS